MPSIFPQLFAFGILAPFILRVVLGVIFIAHGYPKLFKNYSQTVQFFESVNIKPAKLWVFVVGAVEFFGGILLLIGLFTQAAAGLLAINMLVALFWVQIIKSRKKLVGGYEFDLILLAGVLALMFLGAGAFALDLPL